MNQVSFPNSTAPVVIGGLGGSGTRLVAQYLDEAGFNIGVDLNGEYDNLWFTLLFKRIDVLTASEEEFDALVEIFLNAMIGDRTFTRQQVELLDSLASEDRQMHPAQWLHHRVKSLLSEKTKIGAGEKWGWKEPNSHIVLNRLSDRIPNLKYIHVVRNGLDMAFGRNQNQLNFWGRHFIGEEFDFTPYYSLKYWCMVHKRVIRIGETMNGNFLLLNYDSLCLNPEKVVKQLLGFIGKDADSLIPRLVAMVKPPDSMGRFRQYGTEMFAEEDIAYVNSLGFDVNTG